MPPFFIFQDAHVSHPHGEGLVESANKLKEREKKVSVCMIVRPPSCYLKVSLCLHSSPEPSCASSSLYSAQLFLEAIAGRQHRQNTSISGECWRKSSDRRCISSVPLCAEQSRASNPFTVTPCTESTNVLFSLLTQSDILFLLRSVRC